ncbi:MAG: hypothetical protein JWQ19_892 [Subtercola sp.]|nr:hypothetical protein [Subtercola sp.]
MLKRETCMAGAGAVGLVAMLCLAGCNIDHPIPGRREFEPDERIRFQTVTCADRRGADGHEPVDPRDGRLEVI